MIKMVAHKEKAYSFLNAARYKETQSVNDT